MTRLLFRRFLLASALVATITLAGCSVTFPIVASQMKGDKARKPGDQITPGARVEVELRDGGTISGRYSHWSVDRNPEDPAYAMAFAEAVRGDTALTGTPLPGDTLWLYFRKSRLPGLEATFLGVSEPSRPGIYAALRSGEARFFAAGDMISIQAEDGREVPFSRIYRHVLRGDIPVLDDPTVGQVYIATPVGTIAVSAGDIRRILVAGKAGNVATARFVGIVIDVALITAGIIALRNWDCCSMGGSWGGTW